MTYRHNYYCLLGPYGHAVVALWLGLLYSQTASGRVCPRSAVLATAWAPSTLEFVIWFSQTDCICESAAYFQDVPTRRPLPPLASTTGTRVWCATMAPSRLAPNRSRYIINVDTTSNTAIPCSSTSKFATGSAPGDRVVCRGRGSRGAVWTHKPDPHTAGFNGANFEFMGFSGGVFNLLSHERHQINMLLDDFGFKDATFIKELGIKIADTHRIRVTVPEVTGQLTATVNGYVVPFTTKMRGESGRTGVAIETGTSAGSLYMHVQTAQLAILVLQSAYAQHLDVDVSLLAGGLDMDGILGQTILWDKNSTGQLAGDEMDYLVSDIFSDNFARNKFAGDKFGGDKFGGATAGQVPAVAAIAATTEQQPASGSRTT